MQVEHVAIWTEDLEKEKDFYLKYFRSSVSAKYENKEKQFSSYFLNFYEGSRIELMKRYDINSKNKGDALGLAHIAISVGARSDVDRLTSNMEKDGVIIESYPRVTGDGYYESVILDPENNKIELVALDEFQITKALGADLDQILFLQKSCYLSEAEIYNDYTIPPLVQTIDDLKKEYESQTILKLTYKNKIIGSVRGFVKDRTCFIGKLIVNRDYQNKGLGKALIMQIEQHFNNAERFELFTGYTSSKNLHLYSKLGYKEFKREDLKSMVMIFLEKMNNKKSV